MTMDLNPRLAAPFMAKVGQANPDDVLRRIMREMPKANADKIWKAFKQAILADDELNEACLRYYFINAKTRLERVEPNSEEAQQSQRSRQRAIADYQRLVPKLFILDTVMPNGKTMRECTFGYVKTFGGKCAVIGGLGEPNAIIGTTVSDGQVKAALRNK